MTRPLAAHGKVFLAGEYAVLDAGRPALVVGIDRALHASWEPAPYLQLVSLGLLFDGGIPPPELRFAARGADLAARLCAEEGLPKKALRLVYQDDLSLDGTKLGLGGSAAATVLAVRATCAAHGRVLDQEELLSLSLAAHWIEQGGSGSGADVAACALGGVLQVRTRIPWRSAEEAMALPVRALVSARLLEAERVSTPADLRLLLAFTGRPADTRALVREVRAFAQGEPRRWGVLADKLGGCAESLRAALEAAALDPSLPHRQAALDAVRTAAVEMAALGEQASAPIVTEELVHACALAASAGAAGKPSGAGGGDCAVVLCFGDEARDRAESALRTSFPVFRIAPA